MLCGINFNTSLGYKILRPYVFYNTACMLQEKTGCFAGDCFLFGNGSGVHRRDKACLVSTNLSIQIIICNSINFCVNKSKKI